MTSHYFDNNNVYGGDSELESTILVEGVVWDQLNSQEQVTMCVNEEDNSVLAERSSETFLSVNEEGNNTEYFSVLEMSDDGVMGDLNLNAVNSAITDETLLTEETTPEDEPNLLVQPLLYGIEGSDDYLAVQVTCDNEGNVSRLQYRMRQNENGEFESVPGTAEILPINNDVNLENIHQNTLEEENCCIKDKLETEPDVRLFVKQEFINEPTLQDFSPLDEEQEPYYHEQQTEEIETKTCDSSKNIASVKSEWIKDEILHDPSDSSLPYPKMNIDTSKSNYISVTEANQISENQDRFFTSSDIYDNENITISQEFNEENETSIDGVENNQAIVYPTEESQTYPQIIVENHQEMLQNFLEGSENSEDINYGSDIENMENQENADADDEHCMSPNETDSSDDNSNVSGSDAEEYQIVEGIHITGDTDIQDPALKTVELEKQDNQNLDPLSVNREPTQLIKVLKTQQESILIDKIINSRLKSTFAQNGDLKFNRNPVYYVVKHPEKENVAIPNVGNNKIYKVNPRSILKTSFAQLEQQKEEKKHTIQELNLNSSIDKIDKRFARNKDVIQALHFQNYIARTTIPHAPVRNERLPRKQTIKPVQRADEEIIVKEVVVSSQGFVEFPDESILPKTCIEIVQLSDSEEDSNPRRDERTKRRYQKSKSKTSEIIISDTEEEHENNKIVQIDLSAESEDEVHQTETQEKVKKRRGRPRKNPLPQDSKQTQNLSTVDKNQSSESASSDSSFFKRKRGRPPKNKNDKLSILKTTNNQGGDGSHASDNDSGSSAKKQKTDSENVNSSSNSPKLLDSSEDTKAEIPCAKCSKSFPSQGSLKTHMQYHSLKESTTRNGRRVTSRLTTHLENVTSQSKYQCKICNEHFKNNALLSKHQKLHESNSRALECGICKKVFVDVSQLTNHKRSHVKEQMFKSTIPPKLSPKISKTNKQIKSPKKDSLRCIVCLRTFVDLATLNAHKTNSHKQFSCVNCAKKFYSKVAWETHVRQQCVKRRLSSEKGVSVNVRKSLLVPPKRASRYHHSPNKNKTLNASIKRTPTQTIKIQCDKCEIACSSYKKLFQHKVIKHGLETPDKSIVECNAKKALYKARPDHGGVPATRKLGEAWIKLMNKIE